MPSPMPPHASLSPQDVIQVILRDHGYERRESLDADWSIYWHRGDMSAPVLSRLAGIKPHQRLNKLPGARALTDKGSLWLCFDRMRKLHGGDVFAYVPQSFLLPDEAAVYEQHLRAR